MTEHGALITIQNIDNVREMIRQKECMDKPFWATSQTVTSVITDYDHFPYKRWFRGRYYCDKPIVAEREAGYRKRHDGCYSINKCCSSINDDPPQVCFQAPCSIVYPCNECDPASNPLKDKLYAYKTCINLYR